MARAICFCLRLCIWLRERLLGSNSTATYHEDDFTDDYWGLLDRCDDVSRRDAVSRCAISDALDTGLARSRILCSNNGANTRTVCDGTVGGGLESA